MQVADIRRSLDSPESVRPAPGSEGTRSHPSDGGSHVSEAAASASQRSRGSTDGSRGNASRKRDSSRDRARDRDRDRGGDSHRREDRSDQIQMSTKEGRRDKDSPALSREFSAGGSARTDKARREGDPRRATPRSSGPRSPTRSQSAEPTFFRECFDFAWDHVGSRPP